MKVSLSWLEELVDYNLSPQELAEKLSLFSIGVKQGTNDFLELDLTYNRGDLLSMRGVAREVAAITGSMLKLDEIGDIYNKILLLQKNVKKVPVKVENLKLCPLYCVAKIEGLKVGPSSPDWVKKLSDCGMRSVNNIADATNLIMLEYGQPMHAFDARGVKDETIIVRVAKKGERVITLDGKTRDLDPSNLLIADSLNALGIAGVMGGKESEVSESTTTILLEAAIFDPVENRKTAKRLGLNSEASKRFQHGLTRTNLLQALAAAIKMYESLGGKLTAISTAGDLEDKPKTVQLTQEKINSLLGVDIPEKDVEKSLTSLGFHTRSGGSNSWEVTVPYWRLDINIEEDLIEEVARMYGYEKIEGKKLEGKVPKPLDESLQNFIHNLKVKLSKAGLTEVQTYSFYSSSILSSLRKQGSINNLVKVANPISSETEYLRNHLWPNLVEVVCKNMRKGYKDIAIFEIGKVYSPRPKESYRLAIALMNGTGNPITELYSISRGVKLPHTGCVQEDKDLFHPTRYTNAMAEIHPRVLNNFGIDKRVAILEIDIEPVV